MARKVGCPLLTLHPSLFGSTACSCAYLGLFLTGHMYVRVRCVGRQSHVNDSNPLLPQVPWFTCFRSVKLATPAKPTFGLWPRYDVTSRAACHLDASDLLPANKMSGRPSWQQVRTSEASLREFSSARRPKTSRLRKRAACAKTGRAFRSAFRTGIPSALFFGWDVRLGPLLLAGLVHGGGVPGGQAEVRDLEPAPRIYLGELGGRIFCLDHLRGCSSGDVSVLIEGSRKRATGSFPTGVSINQHVNPSGTKPKALGICWTPSWTGWTRIARPGRYIGEGASFVLHVPFALGGMHAVAQAFRVLFL